MVVILLIAVITQEAKAKPGWSSGGGGGSCGRGGCGGGGGGGSGGGSNCGSRGCGGGSTDEKNSRIQTCPKLLIVPLILLRFQEAEEVIVVEGVLEDLTVAAEAVEVVALVV